MMTAMNAVTSLLTTRRNWEVSNIPAFLPEHDSSLRQMRGADPKLG